jgi:hypothetical protein
MFDRPDRGDLLDAAETTLRDDIIPGLGGAERYSALMVASAVAMARREIAAGHAPARAVLDAFADLYGQDNVYRSGEDSAARVQALLADLAREIRDGEYDDALTGTVHAVLRTLVVERLKLSNPRFLETSERDRPHGR